MIGYLRGQLLEMDEHGVLLDVNGVGYEVMMPAVEIKVLRARLHPQNGETPSDVALFIYYHVSERQPAPVLIGFNDRQAKEFFKTLLTVSEIGPNLAAKAMVMPVCEIASAIERRDVRTLGTLPGIGKRKADQIVATLKGKVLPFALLPAPELAEAQAPAPGGEPDFVADVTQVLVESLGYKPVEADRMVRDALKRRPEIAGYQELLEEIWAGENGRVTSNE
jgi:holliday junction DNA helicase RuvA